MSERRRVHVLSCGTSILHNLKERRVGGPRLAAAVDTMTDWAATELDRDQPASRWRASFDREIGPYLGPLRKIQSPLTLSAEVASLYRHAEDHGPLAPEDAVALLASDTPGGMLAALLNAARLGRVVRVHTAPELDVHADGELLLDAAAPGGPASAVHVVRIPRLLPHTTPGFTGAMRDVSKAMLWAGWLRPRRGELVLHLAGGYKATLPYLVVLAEYVKAVQPPVRAYCLHEGDQPGSPTNHPVEVYLRRVDSHRDHQALAVVAGHRNPDDDRLRDFAYTTDAGRAAFTPVGEILWDLLSAVEGRP